MIMFGHQSSFFGGPMRAVAALVGQRPVDPRLHLRDQPRIVEQSRPAARGRRGNTDRAPSLRRCRRARRCWRRGRARTRRGGRRGRRLNLELTAQPAPRLHRRAAGAGRRRAAAARDWPPRWSARRRPERRVGRRSVPPPRPRRRQRRDRRWLAFHRTPRMRGRSPASGRSGQHILTGADARETHGIVRISLGLPPPILSASALYFGSFQATAPRRRIG